MQSNKHHLLLYFLLFLTATSLFAQDIPVTPVPIKAEQDTLVVSPITKIIRQDTVAVDSVQKDSLPKKEPLLLDKIRYKAKDYAKLSQKDHKIYLYNEAEIYYQDTELKAGVIIMDYEKNEVYAGRIKDSTGTYSQIPYFKQGSNEVRPDSIRFNFDTQKAFIFNSRSEQQAGLGTLGSDAMKVYAQITKKENDSVYFLYEGKLTTSKDTIDPDYYIR
ncbi:MAG: LPS-assembly protein LptD, partial [Flavobacteriales bacterium]